MKRDKSGIVYYTIFFTALFAISVYVLLDTFVIPHAISRIETVTESSDELDSGQQNQGLSDKPGMDDISETGDIAQEDVSETENISEMGDMEQGDVSETENISERGDAARDGVSESEDLSNDVRQTDSAGRDNDDTSSVDGIYTDNSYQDDNISINITTQVYDNTTVYIADVVLSNAGYLKTALADDTFGANITEKTSTQAESKNAILAVNGDFYGADKKGYVIKNGVIYRDSVRDDSEYNDLAVYADGSFEIINEENISAQQLVDNGVVQLFAFGPALVENGQIVVDENTEVGKAMASNPRTAIGIIDELAQLMKSYGCEVAYNLDGGGSSTMYFNGQVISAIAIFIVGCLVHGIITISGRSSMYDKWYLMAGCVFAVSAVMAGCIADRKAWNVNGR